MPPNLPTMPPSLMSLFLPRLLASDITLHHFPRLLATDITLCHFPPRHLESDVTIHHFPPRLLALNTHSQAYKTHTQLDAILKLDTILTTQTTPPIIH